MSNKTVGSPGQYRNLGAGQGVARIGDEVDGIRAKPPMVLVNVKAGSAGVFIDLIANEMPGRPGHLKFIVAID